MPELDIEPVTRDELVAEFGEDEVQDMELNAELFDLCLADGTVDEYFTVLTLANAKFLFPCDDDPTA